MTPLLLPKLVRSLLRETIDVSSKRFKDSKAERDETAAWHTKSDTTRVWVQSECAAPAAECACLTYLGVTVGTERERIRAEMPFVLRKFLLS